MDTNLLARKRFRKRFGNIPEILDIPNLIEVQKSSYEEFLQRNVDPNKSNTNSDSSTEDNIEDADFEVVDDDKK